MLFNDNLVFIHVPKTGGMAVTKYLIEVLPLLDGQMPANLTILRTENLEGEFRHTLQTLGVRNDARLLRDNESRHEHPLRYYTRAAEEAVYRRYKWVFDVGFYPRLDPESLPQVLDYPVPDSSQAP
jgi:hypothetical protein